MSSTLTSTLENNVMQAKDGNVNAFSKLVEATQNLTTSIALTIVKDKDASEDVAQQVYIKIWQQLPSLKKEQSFLPWLRQMTRYTALNYLRDNKITDKLDAEANDTVLNNLDADAEAFSDSLDKVEINQRLRELLDNLPAESREIVLLYYREEESTRSVAELLELTEANVRKKLSRIRQQLRQDWLKKYGKLVLSTAPGLGFTSLITNLATSATPVAAASLGSSMAASQSSTWTKLLAWLGGTALGALLGILAVALSTRMLIASIEDESYIEDLKRNRNYMIYWIIVSCILLAISYEFTTGWIAPVITYLLFAVGLVRMVEITQMIAVKAGLKNESRFCLDPINNPRLTRVVNWAGPLMGFIGLMVGLFGSGRIG